MARKVKYLVSTISLFTIATIALCKIGEESYENLNVNILTVCSNSKYQN